MGGHEIRWTAEDGPIEGALSVCGGFFFVSRVPASRRGERVQAGGRGVTYFGHQRAAVYARTA